MSYSTSLAFDKYSRKVDLSHNERTTKKPLSHVNYDKTPSNIKYTTKYKDVDEIHDMYFSVQIEEYNKGKKPSRKMKDNYYQHLRDIGERVDKKTGKKSEPKETHAELILAIGHSDENTDPKLEEIKIKALNEYYLGNDDLPSFEDRNPNLKIFNSVLHVDEQNPHIHVNFVPITTEKTNTKRGLKNQISCSGSLKEIMQDQGVECATNRDYTTEWKKKENDIFESIMLKYGLDRTPTIPKKDNPDRPDLTTNQYQTICDQVEDRIRVKLEKEYQAKNELLEKEYQEKNELLEDTYREKNELLTIKENSIKTNTRVINENFEIVNRELHQELDRMEKQAKDQDDFDGFLECFSKHLDEREVKVKTRETNVGTREVRVSNREVKVGNRETDVTTRETDITTREDDVKKQHELNSSNFTSNLVMQKKLRDDADELQKKIDKAPKSVKMNFSSTTFETIKQQTINNKNDREFE